MSSGVLIAALLLLPIAVMAMIVAVAAVWDFIVAAWEFLVTYIRRVLPVRRGPRAPHSGKRDRMTITRAEQRAILEARAGELPTVQDVLKDRQHAAWVDERR